MSTPATSEYSPLHPQLVLWIARWGLPDKDIAREIGVTLEVLQGWKRDHPEMTAAIESGRAYWVNLAENSLQKLIKGYDYEETHVTVNSKKQTSARKVTKHVPPNVAAIKFLVENRKVFQILKSIEKKMPGGHMPETIENIS